MDNHLETLLLYPGSEYSELYSLLPRDMGILQKHNLILQRNAKIPVTNIPEISLEEFVSLVQDFLDIDVVPQESVTKDDLLRILLGTQQDTGVNLLDTPEDLTYLSPFERISVQESLLENIGDIPASIRTNISKRRELFKNYMKSAKINPEVLNHIISTELDKTELDILSKMAGLEYSQSKAKDLYDYVIKNPLSATAEVILGTYGVKGYTDIKLENLISEGVYPKLKGGFISIVENAVYYNLHGSYFKKEL